jgi:hypothetical protein
MALLVLFRDHFARRLHSGAGENSVISGSDWTITLKTTAGVQYVNREDEEKMQDLVKQWAMVLHRAGVATRLADYKTATINRWAGGFREYLSEEDLTILDEFLSWIHLKNINIVAFEIY